jgi:HEAT repeat protein
MPRHAALLALLLVPAAHAAEAPRPDPQPGPEVQRRVRELREGLKAERPRDRAEAARSMGALGPAARDAVPDLLGLLKDRDAEARTEAAVALLRIDQTRAREALAVLRAELADPKRPPEPYLFLAVFAVGDLRPEKKELVAGLLELLVLDQPLTQLAAAQALDRVGASAAEAAPVLEAALKDREPRVRLHAASGLARVDPRAVDRAADVLEAMLTDKTPELRHEAALRLARAAPARAGRAAEALLPDLKAPGRPVRRNAATALLDIDPELAGAAVFVLAEGLKERDAGERRLTLAALARQGRNAARAEAALREALAPDARPAPATPEERVALAETLLRVRPDRARDSLPLLIDALDERAGQAGKTREILKLIEQLEEIARLEGGEEMVIKGRLESASKPAANHARADVIRLDSVAKLAATGPKAKEAVPLFTTLARDPAGRADKRDETLDGVYRSQAVYGLGRIGPEARPAVPTLLKLYAEEGASPGLRRELAEALKSIDPEAARKAGIR